MSRTPLSPALAGPLLALVLAAPAGADEMLVFKKDSPFKGAAIRVSSYEEKNGRLLLHTAKGEVFSAAKDSVDWAASKEVTARVLKEDAVVAGKLAEEEQAKQAAKAAAEQKPKETLVEASRRYGVEKPGLSVASGSAAREGAPATAAAPAAAGASIAATP